MPKLEHWEQKAIGREARFKNTYSEAFLTELGNYAKDALSAGAAYLIGVGSNAVKGSLDYAFTPKVIMGKNFGKGDHIFNHALLSVEKYGVDKGFQKIGSAVDSMIHADYFYPSGAAVAKQALASHISFDLEKGAAMGNLCGYTPSLEAITLQMRDEIAKQGADFTDEFWRKEIMPHVLRSFYQEELTTALTEVRRLYEEKPELANRTLMERHMRQTAQMLGEIFEDFSLKMANESDYLEAPLSFTPQKRVMPPEITDPEEQKKWKAVTQASLLDSSSQLDRMISAALAPIPPVTAERAQELFFRSLTQPTADQKAYAPGQDPAADRQRFAAGVMTIRDLKRSYEQRNFLMRWFSPTARRERAAIQTMTDTLTHTVGSALGMDASSIRKTLDLKQPYEQEANVAELLEVEQTTYQKPATVTETIQQTVVEPVKKIAESTLETVASVGATAYNAVSSLGSAAMDKVSSAIGLGDDFMSDLTLDFDDDDIFGYSSPTQPAPDKTAEQPTVSETVRPPVQQEGSKEEKPEEKQEEKQTEPQAESTEQTSYLGSLWNGAKYLGGKLNVFNWWGGSAQPEEPAPTQTEPEPAKTEPVQPEETKTEPTKQEETKTEPTKQEETERKDAPEQSAPTEKTAEEPDPLQELRDEIKTRHESLVEFTRNDFTLPNFRHTLSGMLYYRTLERSLTTDPSEANREKVRAMIEPEKAEEGISQIENDKAFKHMKQWVYGRKQINQFFNDFADDPNSLNRTYLDYLHQKNLVNQAAQNRPAKQNELTMEQTAPNKAGPNL